MMKKVFPILLILILLGMALLWKSRPDSTPDPNSSALGVPLSPSSIPSPHAQGVPSTANPDSGSGASKEFREFMVTEANTLNSPHLDPDLAERRVKAEVAKMGIAELQYARDLALSRESAATQRILAVYLLTSGGKVAWPFLKEIALAPRSSERAEPHTIDEVKSAQGNSFSLMAVDSMAKQAATDQKAREELERWAAESQDAKTKNYILRKLREIPAL